MLFSALGTGFALAGAFSYWWDASMRPGQASPWVMIWGILTLVSQVWVFLRSILKDPTTVIIGDGDGDS